MPLPPDLFDLAPAWAQNSRLLFLASLVLSAGITAIGWLAQVAQVAQNLPPLEFNQFLITCIYALVSAIVVMVGSGAVAVKWIATRALKVISENSKSNQDNSRSNQALMKEIADLRKIQEVQMQYFNTVGIAAINQAFDDKENTDLAELPTELPAATRQPKTRR